MSHPPSDIKQRIPALHLGVLLLGLATGAVLLPIGGSAANIAWAGTTLVALTL